MLKECFGFVGLLKLTQRTEQDMIFFLQSQVMIHHPTNLKCIDCYSTAPQTDLHSLRGCYEIYLAISKNIRVEIRAGTNNKGSWPEGR